MGIQSKIIKVNSSTSFLDLCYISDYIAKVIKKGGIIVFPTSSLYGLGCDIFNKETIKKIYVIKKRSFEKPISILIPSIQNLSRVANPISYNKKKLIKKHWPGKVTFVIKANKAVPKILISDSDKIGVRIPYNKIAKLIIMKSESPITATSANVSGEISASCIRNIDTDLLSNVDLIIDSGKLKGGIGSSIIDITVHPPRMIRNGTFFREFFI